MRFNKNIVLKIIVIIVLSITIFYGVRFFKNKKAPLPVLTAENTLGNKENSKNNEGKKEDLLDEKTKSKTKLINSLFSKKNPADIDALKTDLERTAPIVDVVEARLGQVNKVTNLVGYLRASDDITIKSEVDGKISKIDFIEGGAVSGGDVLLEVDDTNLRIQVREVQTQLMLARAEFKRAQELAKSEFLSKSDLEKKRAEVLVLEVKLASIQAELSKFKVHAPFAGKVGLREVSVGDYITRGKELVRLVSDRDIRVDFKVPEMLITGIQTGQIIYIKIDGMHGEFPAEVKAVNPEAEQSSHSFIVRAVLQYQNENMRPGLFVRVLVPSMASMDAILVPESAIVRVGDNDVVFRIVEGMAIKTPVTIGVRQGGEVEVITGINQGDIIVTAGQSRIRDGGIVQIYSSLENVTN